MRCAMAQPCAGSRIIVLRMRRSSVPWTRSVGLLMRWRLPSVDDREATSSPVNKQGEGLNIGTREDYWRECAARTIWDSEARYFLNSTSENLIEWRRAATC